MSDDVEVVLDDPKDDAPEIEIVDEKAPEPEKAPEKTPEEGIQEMKKRLEAERAARMEAERLARQAQRQVNEAQNEVKDANYNMIVNAIETVKGRSEALKAAYRESMSVGDFDKAAEIQEAMAVNAHQLQELKRGKKAIKDQLKESEAQPVQKMEPPKGDIVDQLASQVSSKSAEWLRNHRSDIRDERSVRKMFRAHEDAMDDGIEPDTDEYFEFIEGRMGLNRRVEQEPSPMSEASAPAPRRSTPPPAAPVSRGSTRPNVVRLTRDQAEAARSMGMTEAEYAKNLIALQKEGKLGR